MKTSASDPVSVRYPFRRNTTPLESTKEGRPTEHLLDLELVVELDLVRDGVVLLDEVESLGDDGVVLVLVLADLEEDFDHVLHALVDAGLVEDRAEALVDAVVGLWARLGQERADLLHERDGDLDRVVRRLLEQEDEDLERNNLVGDCGQAGRGSACRSVRAWERATHLAG